jgi:hypothetical protein
MDNWMDNSGIGRAYTVRVRAVHNAATSRDRVSQHADSGDDVRRHENVPHASNVMEAFRTVRVVR